VASVTVDDTTDAVPGPGVRTVAGIVTRLRELVLARELQPGEQIRQEEMARVLGISRVTLREALRVLTTEGLLTHRPNQGYFVTRMSQEDLAQILALLEFLETELLRTARWPTDEEVGELRAINHRLAQAAAKHDYATVNRLNSDLHLRMFRLSPKDIYQVEAERFWTLSEPYRLLHIMTTDAAEIVEEHQQLIDALAAQDRALTLRMMGVHRRHSQDAASSALTKIDPPVRRLATG
jgi:DNA-binding GntR family transcriptional regulator